MLGIDPIILAVGVPGAVFAGISKGGFGSGASFASGAVLALFIDPIVALAIMLPLLMLIDFATLKPYWRKWSWPDARLLILGGLPGVGLGVWLLRAADPDVFRVLIGAISLAFVGWQLAQSLRLIRAPVASPPLWAGGLAGLVAGFTSFISHAGGPAAAVYLLGRGLDKLRYQATTVLVFWAINIAKIVPYAGLGLFTRETLWAGLVLAPFALAGAWLGVRAHHLVSPRVFFAVTYVTLTLTGAKLVWDGVT
jgi:uncharacterized membrane protein YfcA